MVFDDRFCNSKRDDVCVFHKISLYLQLLNVRNLHVFIDPV